METWKDIKGYEGFYQVSNTGKVRSLPRTITLKTKNGKDRPCHFKGRTLKLNEEPGKKSNIMPRYYVAFSKNGKRVKFYIHRLVAQHFIPNPMGLTDVNHIDGDCSNNNVDNLEWCSRLDNMRHAFDNKLIKTQKPVQQINLKTNEVINEFESEADACRAMKVTQGKVGRAIRRQGTCKGHKWKFK
ncbi:NUMOD4 motif-containing HNH endonuclease [Staphylococcus chromogenes]|uniref:NUMOD4 motif-containing HNH endonuclease n=1 Tax=Staphylococcus chromogenes TaxID=46126 RepID=UPI00188F74C3|nr:NUMOD4 motif-containing HNH endonuclease [Staphylococcus chromogenes]